MPKIVKFTQGDVALLDDLEVSLPDTYPIGPLRDKVEALLGLKIEAPQRTDRLQSSSRTSVEIA